MLPIHRKTNPTVTGIPTHSTPGNLISVKAACRQQIGPKNYLKEKVKSSGGVFASILYVGVKIYSRCRACYPLLRFAA